jgi:hypothetical protein
MSQSEQSQQDAIDILRHAATKTPLYSATWRMLGNAAAYLEDSPTTGTSAELLQRAEKVLGLLPCEECDHSLVLHFDRYGCEYERGDIEGDESGPGYALGPCGCKAENLSDDGNDAFLLLRDLRQVRLLREMGAARG